LSSYPDFTIQLCNHKGTSVVDSEDRWTDADLYRHAGSPSRAYYVSVPRNSVVRSSLHSVYVQKTRMTSALVGSRKPCLLDYEVFSVQPYRTLVQIRQAEVAMYTLSPGVLDREHARTGFSVIWIVDLAVPRGKCLDLRVHS